MTSKWLGRQKYQDIEALQKSLVKDLVGTSKVILLGMEFEPVITLGVRGSVEVDLSSHIDALGGYDIVTTDRGGQATLHSPGQLVIYPMLDLRVWKTGVRDFVDSLMQTTCKSLASIGIEASFDPSAPGLYSAQGKIAFCGLRVDRGVVRHGLSVNLKNDLGDFSMIRSCGCRKPRLDSVSRYQDIELSDFFKLWVNIWSADFPLSAEQSLGMT